MPAAELAKLCFFFSNALERDSSVLWWLGRVADGKCRETIDRGQAMVVPVSK
jgi:hypothetical protein